MKTIFKIISIAACVFASFTHAQDNYPSSPVKVIVGFSAGGPVDTVTRLVAAHLRDSLGQSVVVENRPGAGTKIAVEAVASAKPDGLTLLVTGPTSVMAPTVSTASYDPVKDFTPIGQFGQVAQVLVVNKDVPAQNLHQLIEYMKANPGRLNYGTPGGQGTTLHLQMELLQKMAGVSAIQVAYKGSPPALQDLITGRIDMMFDIYSSSAPFIKEGKLRVIGIASAKRSALLPDAPTLSEAGLPGYDMTSWLSLLAPAGIPQAIAAKLTSALQKAVTDPKFQAQLAAQSVEAVYGTPAETARRIAEDDVKIKRLATDLGILHKF